MTKKTKEKPKKEKKEKKSRLFLMFPALRKILICTGAVIGLFLLLIFSYNFIYSKRIFPKTYAGNLNLGGLTYSEAKSLIDETVNEQKDTKITLSYAGKKWSYKAKDLDIEISPEKTLESAWRVGRQGQFNQIIDEQWNALFRGNFLDINGLYNQGKINKSLEDIASEIDIPEKDATIVIKNLVPNVEKESTGKVVDQEKAKQEIFKAVSSLKSEIETTLPVRIAEPKFVLKDAEELLEKTEEILTNKVVLKSEKKKFDLLPKEFAMWLEFGPSDEKKSLLGKKSVLAVKINDKKLDNYIEWLSSEINQEPKDAKFNVKDGRVTAYQNSQNGYELEKEKAKEAVANAVLDLENQTELPIKVTEPLVSSNSAEKMGIKEKVGEGTTKFTGSPQNRRKNISAGANLLHGLIVKPGEEFSTIGQLKPIDASNGYVPELVIKEDRTLPEYGGGLCQVSTTLFRAVMDAGLKISERTNHSYRVSYYEPPVGMDATIYDPSPDFKFVNDLDYPILIQASVDQNSSSITFQLYGTKDGRKVEISDSVVYEVTPPEPALYVESDTLAAGEIKRLESAHNGAKAYFKYKVTKNNKVLYDETFKSVYVPWRARYLYGPGTEIPPVE